MESSNSRYCPVLPKTSYTQFTKWSPGGRTQAWQEAGWAETSCSRWAESQEPRRSWSCEVMWMMPCGSWKGGLWASTGKSVDPASTSHWFCNSGKFLHNWASKSSPVNLGANWSILFLSLYLSVCLSLQRYICWEIDTDRNSPHPSMYKLNSCYLHLPIAFISRFLFIHMCDVVTDHLPLSADLGLPGYRPFSDSLVYSPGSLKTDR